MYVCGRETGRKGGKERGQGRKREIVFILPKFYAINKTIVIGKKREGGSDIALILPERRGGR